MLDDLILKHEYPVEVLDALKPHPEVAAQFVTLQNSARLERDEVHALVPSAILSSRGGWISSNSALYTQNPDTGYQQAIWRSSIPKGLDLSPLFIMHEKASNAMYWFRGKYDYEPDFNEVTWQMGEYPQYAQITMQVLRNHFNKSGITVFDNMAYEYIEKHLLLQDLFVDGGWLSQLIEIPDSLFTSEEGIKAALRNIGRDDLIKEFERKHSRYHKLHDWFLYLRSSHKSR